MKPSIQLRLGQQITMTPQLQQAIKLLQLSTLDLKQEIQDALDSNLMLEVEEDNQPETNNTETAQQPTIGNDANNEQEVQIETPDMPEDLPVDTAWEDIYDVLPNMSSGTVGSIADDAGDYLAQQSADQSLQEHLTWQMGLARFSELDTRIAEIIIDGVSEDGYLQTPLAEVVAMIGHEDVDIEEVEAVLHRIQVFDPPGVAARDLRECLLVQARQLSPEFDDREHVIDLLENHFGLLASRDENQLCRKLAISREELPDILQLIRSLNPRPGSSLPTGSPVYVEPDVFVSKQNGRWRVELNQDTAPRLRVNTAYANMVRRADNSSDNITMKNHLQEARWFIKSLQSRNETLLKVASSILTFQKNFFEYGEEAMQPLVLRDVAEAVDMHESTISRVTTQKYMHTPRGTFEFKYFFSSHVGTANGGEASATAIRALIKKLVAAEKPNKPLSDNKIATLLGDQGIKVARRTVAKYRESMQIPPSNERKRLM
jgi:RNA polymerase sigma-54 factor